MIRCRRGSECFVPLIKMRTGNVEAFVTFCQRVPHALGTFSRLCYLQGGFKPLPLVRFVYPLLFGILVLTASTASAQEAAVRVPAEQMPSGYMLESAYPNPFNPSATIGFAVVRTQDVELSLYNALGRKVRTLFSGQVQGQTRFEAQVNGEGLPSGLYLVRLVGDSFSTTRRVTLLK